MTTEKTPTTADETLDPTGGESAREARRHPDAPRPILDPTDPRYGRPSTGRRAAAKPRDGGARADGEPHLAA